MACVFLCGHAHEIVVIWRLGAMAIVALVVLPLLGIVASLLSWQGDMWRHLARTQLGEIVNNSLVLMVGVGVGTTIVGVGTAWLVTACRFAGSRSLEWALLLPLVLPTYIVGYAYADLLAYAGPLQTALRALAGWTRGDYWFPEIGSAAGVAALFTLVLYPYVYLAARAAFLSQSPALLQASRVLGHGPWRTFLRIALPLARPAIAAGVILALLEALADFGTVQYFGIPTFTTAIYRTWFGAGSREGAAQISVILLAIALALLTIERHLRGRARFHVQPPDRNDTAPVPLSRPRSALAILACALPILFGFVLPTIHLAQLALNSGESLVDRRLLRDTANSVTLAGLATLAIVAMALFLAYAARLVRRRSFDRTLQFAALGYAIPGAVIAVGIALPLVWADRAIDALAQTFFDFSSGLLLSGTMLALLLAYIVRFLAVGMANIGPGLATIDQDMDASARLLGATPRQVLRHIHLPMLRSPAVAAALIVFVEVLKELPATLLIRPFNFDTLAVGVYRFASDERLAQAAAGAILIVLVSLAPVILLSRAISSPRAP
jgi:iron(III) transport system permease protein